MGPLNNEEVVNPKTKNIRLFVKRVFISDDFDGELVSLLSFKVEFGLLHYEIYVTVTCDRLGDRWIIIAPQFRSSTNG